MGSVPESDPSGFHALRSARTSASGSGPVSVPRLATA